MIKQVGLMISLEDLQNYDYKKIEKLLKDQLINVVQKELEQERTNLNIKFELEERFGQTIVRAFAEVIIDFNTK
jgi:hypothetical protein